MNSMIVKADADLMMDSSIFMHTIAGLVTDNLCEQADEDGRPFLSPFRLEGLMKGMQLAAASLEERSEWIREMVDKEEARKEEMTKAALQRRQGQDSNLGSSVGAECGTQRAA